MGTPQEFPETPISSAKERVAQPRESCTGNPRCRDVFLAKSRVSRGIYASTVIDLNGEDQRARRIASSGVTRTVISTLAMKNLRKTRGGLTISAVASNIQGNPENSWRKAEKESGLSEIRDVRHFCSEGRTPDSAKINL